MTFMTLKCGATGSKISFMELKSEGLRLKNFGKYLFLEKKTVGVEPKRILSYADCI